MRASKKIELQKPRRVLVINHFAVPLDEPGGTRHIELFSRLENWEFVILAARLNPISGKVQRDVPGFVFVPVVPYGRNGIGRIFNWCSFALSALVAGLRAPRPNVVYASSPHLLAGLAGWLLARVRRAAFVLEIRDLWPRTLIDMGYLSENSGIYKLLHALELFLYRRADRIIAMAPGTVSTIAGHGIRAECIVYLPNGADPDDFDPSATREALRKRYGFTRLTAVYAGAHGPANGLDLLIDAAEQLRDLDLELILVGDGVEKVRLQTLALARGLNNVRFVDPVPKSAIPDLLGAADFGLHVLADVDLFRSAVSPNKLFDYMAAGLPVVTNCPGFVTDVLMTAGAGLSSLPTRLADALRTMTALTNSQREVMGRKGRVWMEQNHTRSASARQLGEVLESVVGINPKRGSTP